MRAAAVFLCFRDRVACSFLVCSFFLRYIFFSASVLVCTSTFGQATSTEAVFTELGMRSSDYAVFNIAILVLVLLYMQY